MSKKNSKDDLPEELVRDMVAALPERDPSTYVEDGYLQELADKSVRSRYGSLRMEAALAYVLDPEGRSIESLRKDPRFSHLSSGLLENWSSEDQWVSQRAKFLANWAKQMQAFLGEELVQARVQTWRSLQHVESLALQHLESEEVTPRSWEGVLKAYLDLTKRSEELYGAIADEITPDRVQNSPNVITPVEVSTSSAPSAADEIDVSQLSEEQLDALAAKILGSKRAATREEHKIDADAADQSIASPEEYEHTPTVKKIIERATEKSTPEAKLAYIDDETGELI